VCNSVIHAGLNKCLANRLLRCDDFSCRTCGPRTVVLTSSSGLGLRIGQWRAGDGQETGSTDVDLGANTRPIFGAFVNHHCRAAFRQMDAAEPANRSQRDRDHHPVPNKPVASRRGRHNNRRSELFWCQDVRRQGFEGEGEEKETDPLSVEPMTTNHGNDPNPTTHFRPLNWYAKDVRQSALTKTSLGKSSCQLVIFGTL